MIRVLLLSILMLSGCSREVTTVLHSPSGAFLATAEISGDEAGPRRHCIRLKVADPRTKQELTYQTGASNYQKWALTWSPSGSLVLYSSDIGVMAYDIQSGQIVEREPSDHERELGGKAYEKKYRKPQ